MKKVREGFYHELFVLVGPIVVQNLIISSVSMADVIMLGRVDQTSISASSLAGQVQFLLNIVFFGLGSALTILAAQYSGKGDKRAVSKIFGIGLIISAFFSILATALAFLCPSAVMRVWTNDEELVKAGADYLRYVALSYFFAGISEPYLSIMRSCGRVKLSTFVSAVTLTLNVTLNAILIFGLLGMPKMGIMGAALATTISRGAEFAICSYNFFHQNIIIKSAKEIFGIPLILIKDFWHYSVPAFVNDAMWGLAFNMNSIIMGHLGTDIVAANSVVSVARDLVSTLGFSISVAASILLGKEIGEGRLDLAKEDASNVMKTAVMASIFSGFVLLILTPFIPNFVKISDTASHYLTIMLLINTVYQFGAIMNTVMISSLFRCGGDSRYGMILDITCMWGFAVPLGLISAFVLKLPPIIVYCLMCTDEFAKMPFALHHYKAGTWIKNLTREL